LATFEKAYLTETDMYIANIGIMRMVL